MMMMQVLIIILTRKQQGSCSRLERPNTGDHVHAMNTANIQDHVHAMNITDYGHRTDIRGSELNYSVFPMFSMAY
jgi:hypothetical protein